MGRGLAGSIAARMQALYRRYVGEPESLRTVYAGFGLFFGGVALSVAGVAVFLASTVPESGAVVWQLREVAIVLAAMGLPVFLLSFLVLLPVDRRAYYVAGAGGVVCLGAIALFVVAYPFHWNVPGRDYSAAGVLTYALGGVLLAAATGSALVTTYVRRAGDEPAADEGAAVETADREEVSEEAVRKDIEETVSSAELSWGGVEKTETRRPRIDTTDPDLDTSGMDVGVTEETRAESVDGAVDGLKALRGGEARLATGEGTDEQASALQEVRERDDAEPDGDHGSLRRLRNLLSR